MIYLYYCWIDHKRFFRYWQNLFFIYCYPLMLVGIFGMIFGSKTEIGGAGYLSYALPGYLAIAALSALFLGVFNEFLAWRRMGATQIFSRTPLSFGVMTSLTASTHVIHALLAQLLTIVFARVVFGCSLPALLPFLLVQALFLLSIYSLGYFFYVLVLDEQLNSVVRTILFFLIMFLSGAALPVEMFPPVLQQVSQFFPLNYGIDLLKPFWDAHSQRSSLLNIMALLIYSFVFLALSWLIRGLRLRAARRRGSLAS